MKHAFKLPPKWRSIGLALSLAAVCSAQGLERLEPAAGTYLGFTVGSVKSIPELNARLGFAPAVYVQFFHFEMTAVIRRELTNFLAQVAEVQAIALLTLEPWNGLETVTQKSCREIAQICANAEAQGIGGIIIRFAHEMNGNWYAWGQQPFLYKEKFRLLAQSIHSMTTRSAMLWAPNYGVGYPFERLVPPPGSSDYLALDTNKDGQITTRDDPYEPYYPGDDVVDWVGMTLYHWGRQFPWGENEMPEPGSLAGALTGTFQGSVPNFYARYCQAGGKPFAIAETAAFYNTQAPGPAELDLKQAWWRQIFNTIPRFPMVKCVNWFDEFKPEPIANNDLIDWRITSDPAIRTAFLQDLHNGGQFLLTADDLQRPALAISRHASQVLLHWTSRIDHQYQLFSTEDLKKWTRIGHPIAGTGGELRASFQMGTSGAEIYRLEVLRP